MTTNSSDWRAKGIRRRWKQDQATGNMIHDSDRWTLEVERRGSWYYWTVRRKGVHGSYQMSHGHRVTCLDAMKEAEFVARDVDRERRRLSGQGRVASREEQYGRYIDCGPQDWDDRDGGP